MAREIMHDGHKRAKRLAYMREYYAARRRRMIEMLGGRCTVCGSPDHLEFDHIDRKAKTFGVSEAWGAKKRLLELAKCQLLCGDCHKVKTYLERGHRISSARLVEHAAKWWGGWDSNPTTNGLKIHCSAIELPPQGRHAVDPLDDQPSQGYVPAAVSGSDQVLKRK